MATKGALPSKKPITRSIGVGGFHNSYLGEKIVAKTPHKILAMDVYNNKKHLPEPPDGSPL